MSRRALKQSILNISQQIGLIRLLQMSGSSTGNVLCVLVYHRADLPNSPMSRRLYDLVSATPEQFDAQMRLVASSFHPVSAEDVLAAVDGGKRLPRYAVLVTVDDAYRDFKEVIFPIAQRYGIRPILFVPTAYMNGDNFWWDRLFRAMLTMQVEEMDSPVGRLSVRNAAEREGAFDLLADYMRRQPFALAKREIDALCESVAPASAASEPVTLNWDDLRELSHSGVTIASHTHTHPILTNVSLTEARQEILHSQELILNEIGQAFPIFAFPDGREHAVNTALITTLQETGFKIAFTMNEGCARLDNDPLLRLPRVIMSRRNNLAQFHLRITSLYQDLKHRSH